MSLPAKIPPTVTVDSRQIMELLSSVYSHGFSPNFRKGITLAVEEQTGCILTTFANAYNGEASHWVDADKATEADIRDQRTKEIY